jgi:hypothetical protein
VPRFITSLSALIAKKEVELSNALQVQNVDFFSFAEYWFLSHFASLFTERVLIQIWDQIILNGKLVLPAPSSITRTQNILRT